MADERSKYKVEISSANQTNHVRIHDIAFFHTDHTDMVTFAKIVQLIQDDIRKNWLLGNEQVRFFQKKKHCQHFSGAIIKYFQKKYQKIMWRAESMLQRYRSVRTLREIALRQILRPSLTPFGTYAKGIIVDPFELVAGIVPEGLPQDIKDAGVIIEDRPTSITPIDQRSPVLLDPPRRQCICGRHHNLLEGYIRIESPAHNPDDYCLVAVGLYGVPFAKVPDAIRALTAKYKRIELKRKRPRGEAESEYENVNMKILDMNEKTYESLPNKLQISVALEEYQAACQEVDEYKELQEMLERDNYGSDDYNAYKDYYNGSLDM